MWGLKQREKDFTLVIDNEQKDKTWLMKQMEVYFDKQLIRRIPENYYNKHSIIPPNDADRIYYEPLLQKWSQQEKINTQELALGEDERRALGCMMGLAIGDALGASTEFQDFQKHRKYWIENDFQDLQKCIQQKRLHQRHGEIGIWTDDCSMAVAMSDSILLQNYKFVPKHVRYMFNLWLEHGLGNGGRRFSIGLGGNISISMSQFKHEQKDFTEGGDRNTSGNGSLMRLGPVPIAFRQNQKQAMEEAANSSRTTHQGEQAQECCRLLTLIIVRLINRKSQQNWRDVLDKACSQFQTKNQSVNYLAKSKQQTQEMYKQSCQNIPNFSSANKSFKDRNWNWKDPNFTYSEYRAQRQPGYIGSYCMDALSMALHIVWSKNNFKEMVLWAINMGGDCDTVGAIVGQMAGAVEGFSDSMFHLYSQMQDFTKKRYEIFLKGVKLGTRRKYFEETPINQNSKTLLTK